eukprot:UN02269
MFIVLICKGGFIEYLTLTLYANVMILYTFVLHFYTFKKVFSYKNDLADNVYAFQFGLPFLPYKGYIIWLAYIEAQYRCMSCTGFSQKTQQSYW